MRRALNRFMDWIYHPSIRREPILSNKATPYRYPSPGNILPDQQPDDYRVPFSASEYNVRYNSQLTYEQSAERSSEFISLKKMQPIEKLVVLGFLKNEQRDNEAAVQQAKNKFETKFRIPVEKNVLRNDFDIDVDNIEDPEKMRELIINNFVSNSLDYQEHKFEIDDAYKTNPDLHYCESLDLYTIPHFQQARIENAYTLEQVAKARAEAEGGIDVRKGQAKFWKALDDSNDPENVKKVQQKIGDQNPLDFDLRNAKVVLEFDDKGNVVDLHKKQ